MAAGFTVDHSEAGLYLWTTRNEDCWSTVDCLPPAEFWRRRVPFTGQLDSVTVRLALTASDERISAAVTRLTA